LKRDKERVLDGVIESTIGLISELSLPGSIWRGFPNFVGLRGIFSAFKSCIQDIRSVRLECYWVKGDLASGKSLSEMMRDREDVLQAA
jgi:hypothetical protein